MTGITAKYTEDIHIYRLGGAEAILERFTSKGETLTCEMTVAWVEGPYAGELHGPARTNLLADRTLKSVAKHCAEQIPDAQWPDRVWWQFLAGVRRRSIDRIREGDPLTPLIEIEADTNASRFLLAPFIEVSGRPTVVAGGGGSMKSLVAMATCLAVATGHRHWTPNRPRETSAALYLDWETDGPDSRNVAEALCRGAGVDLPANLFYQRLGVPLSVAAPELARKMERHDIGFVVIDSKGAAAGGSVNADDAVADLFRASRRLAVPHLIIDHLTKAAAEGRTKASPIGSVFSQNLASQVWTVRADELSDGTTAVWQLTKSNRMRRGMKMAWRANFTTTASGWYDRITLEPTDPVEMTAPEVTNLDKITAVIRAKGPLGTSSLAEAADITAATVRKVLERSPDVVGRMSDGRITLLMGDEQTEWVSPF